MSIPLKGDGLYSFLEEIPGLTSSHKLRHCRKKGNEFIPNDVAPQLLSSGDWSQAVADALLGGNGDGPRRGAVNGAQRRGPSCCGVGLWG